MAGQEGFEPPSPGFGVRCSTVRATGLHSFSFCFLVNRMGPTETTVLLQRKLIGASLFVPRGRVVSPFALRTSQRDDVCRHCLYPSSRCVSSLMEAPEPPRRKAKIQSLKAKGVVQGLKRVIEKGSRRVHPLEAPFTFSLSPFAFTQQYRQRRRRLRFGRPHGWRSAAPSPGPRG